MTTKRSNPDHSRRDFIRHSAVVAAASMILPGHVLGATPEFSSISQDRWPGRLVVGGKVLDDFMVVKEEASPDPSWIIRVFQSVSEPTLQIRAQWRTIGAVTEWIPFLVNNNAAPSARVSEVRSLAASWRTRGAVDFYGNKGSSDGADDFADRIQRGIRATVELMPEEGRSSSGILPFFALTDQHDSLAIGIGWSGRWYVRLRHVSGNLQVEVGLPKVGLVLRPWESVRLPSILLAQAPGRSADHARRVVRAHVNNHVMPRGKDGKNPNFTAYATVSKTLRNNPAMTEKDEFEQLERAAALGIETYWIDAGWYGKRIWFEEVGNWNVRTEDFPRGLRPLSDRAHALGMKFVVWMEPERARTNSEWARAHPDLFLPSPDHNETANFWKKDNLLLNLGDPRAVDLAFSKISALITEFNMDIFRHDFNAQPLDAWYAADAPDRMGITEIRFVEGLYALWDRILAAHPGVLIENCSSGGRRIDLESVRRALPLWRSDYLMNKGPPEMDIANQIHGWGLGHWMADHLALIGTFDAYALRSTLATGFMPFRPLPKDAQDSEYADAIAAVAENKRLRSLLTEERIGLIAPVLEKEAWMAYQHHRHADASGIIVALRGPGAETNAVTLRPEHLDVRAMYQITKWDDYQASAPTRIAGAELKEILVEIPKTRSSVLIEYQRV